MKSLSEVKVRASKLRDVLSDMGHQLKHSQSLEVISKIEGYPDWNTHTADITKQQQLSERYPDDKNTERSTTSPDHPVVDAIKSDNEALLKQSLTGEVLSNKLIMAEAFYQSVVLERVSLAEVLIAQGADVGSVVIRQLSLFEFVIHTERESYLKMLVFKFKHLKGIHPKSSKVLPLVISLLNKDDDALEPVRILLDQGANINAQTSEGETALLIAGLSTNNLDLVALLVERGADVNLPNENGCTPLMDAAELGKNDILKYLLNNGADIGAKKFGNISALDMARKTGNFDAIEILVSKSKSNK